MIAPDEIRHPASSAPVQDHESAPDATVRLPAVLDMHAVQELAAELQTRDWAQRPCIVQGEDVARVGTPGLQLLCVLAAHVAALGQPFRLEAPSTVLRESLIRVGLEHNLSVWEATP